jgi:predicted RNA binding protein YcfA (HicA-like mRNA interferase family)
MSRLTPLHWRTPVRVFEQLGYRWTGQRGSHIKLEKPGTARPLIVPRYTEVGVGVIAALIRTAGITREGFFALLTNC